MPEGMRQAALHLIDYQLTPMLVDQWRCVNMLFIDVRRGCGGDALA